LLSSALFSRSKSPVAPISSLVVQCDNIVAVGTSRPPPVTIRSDVDADIGEVRGWCCAADVTILSAGGTATAEIVVRSIGTCLTIALLLSTPALAAKAPKGYHVVSNGQSESAHHPHAQAQVRCSCARDQRYDDMFGHTPDKLNDDAGGETGKAAKGNRGARSGMPGLSGFF
jgi:hypothetical protein